MVKELNVADTPLEEVGYSYEARDWELVYQAGG